MLREKKERMVRGMVHTMSAGEAFKLLSEMMCEVALKEWGIPDPLGYAKSKELVAAINLGHTPATKYSGADAINKKNQPVEYKSTTGPKAKGSYTGISNKDTWEELERYLKNEKIACYSEHFYNRFDKTTGKHVESYMIPGDVVYAILLPKLKKQWHNRKNSKTTPADPRLSASVTPTEVKKHGKLVFSSE